MIMEARSLVNRVRMHTTKCFHTLKSACGRRKLGGRIEKMKQGRMWFFVPRNPLAEGRKAGSEKMAESSKEELDFRFLRLEIRKSGIDKADKLLSKI